LVGWLGFGLGGFGSVRGLPIGEGEACWLDG